MVDEDRPQAWREGIADALIKKFVGDGYVVVVQVGTTKHFLLPEGVNLDQAWERVVHGARVQQAKLLQRSAH